MTDHSRFKDLLDSKHQWPGDYTFKFVCVRDQLENLKELFVGKKLELKESAQGKYVSVTVTLRLNSSDAVIEIYEKAAQVVPGLISL